MIPALPPHRAGPPAWTLLDTDAYMDDTQNATTATACTSTGQPIQPGPTDDYFIYRAGSRPTLRLLPGAYSGAEFVGHALVGVVPIGDDEHFVLAALSYCMSMEETHQIHIFRSDRGTWTSSKPLVLTADVYLDPSKVIALGGGDLGWVDLRQCILVCDVLNDDPNPRLIPLPKLLTSNQHDKSRRMPRGYRDVTVRVDDDGSITITCVEIENCLKRFEPRDVSTADVLHDSELPLGIRLFARYDRKRVSSPNQIDLATDLHAHTDVLICELSQIRSRCLALVPSRRVAYRRSMPHSDDAVATSDPPAWILLDGEAVMEDRQNATIATALTSTGQPVQVTLVAADPPRDSYLCVHFPSLSLNNNKRKRDDDEERQSGRVSLIGSKTWSRPPPVVACSGAQVFSLGTRGIVPLAGGDDDFVVAVLCALEHDETTFELHVFRSDRATWTNKGTVLEDEVFLSTSKVIALGDGELGWTDLRLLGILVCDVLSDDDPNPRIIPLPKLLPSNRPAQKECRLDREYRDVVVCADGTIRCVEIERVLKLVEVPDVSTADVLRDADLKLRLSRSSSNDTSRYYYRYGGWRVITWNRAVVGDNCWHKCHLVHVDDIVANDPAHTALLLQMGGPNLRLRNLITKVPSLSIHAGNVVYLTWKANSRRDSKTWALAIDMVKKTVLEVAPVSVPESSRFYLACASPNYLKIDA
ncbi:hypothetical protein QOZ80_3BG0291670 [Eleusine coracana subsp. coracana]|nr:hypothetical protein QOZ80_3BG0291670 [Eleusine coracana subsp. coracana]